MEFRTIEFGLLGPVEVKREGVALALGGPKQRALLALLLLNANRPVSRDHLIEGLWGSSPPASAAASLDSYVSRLRRLLGSDRLERQPPGYVLRVEPGELDVERFDTALAETRLSSGVETQARLLREGLGLWRGPALADLLYEPFANVEAEALEARRLSALEQRFDVDLASGATAELVGELEELVRGNPLRERLVGQLALAFYRIGRQADALDVIRAARHRLAEELGLEPSPELRGLEQRILRHDPTLQIAADFAVRPRRRVARWPRLIATAGAVIVAGVLATLLLRSDRSKAPRSDPASSRLAAIDPGGHGMRGQALLTNAPAALVNGFGSLWAADPNGEQILRINATTGEVEDRIAVGGQPSAVTVGADAVWAASAVGGRITRIDPSTDRRTQTIRLGGANATTILFVGGRLWVGDATDRSLVQIDPETGSIRQSITLGFPPTAAAAGDGEIWAAGYDSATVDEVDLASHQIIDSLPVGQGPSAIAFAGRSVWVTNSLDGTVTDIDALTGQTKATVPTGSDPTAIVAGRQSIWVANQYSGTVTQIDAQTDAARATLRTGGEPTTLALAASRLWVGSAPSADLHRGGTLVLSETTHLASVDPAFNFFTEPTQLQRLVYDTLVTFDNAPGATGLRLVPDLALALPQPTDGGTTYTFRLRPGLRYSTGKPVEAADFRRAIQRLFRARAPGTTFYSAIVGTSTCIRVPARCDLSSGIVTDNAARTVGFHLAHPDPDFLFELTEFAYSAPVPAGTPDHDQGFTPVPGTGPYRIAEASRNRVRLERNPFFHEWSHAAQPDGNPDTILWTFPPSHEAEVRDVEEGRADWTLDFIPVSQLHTIERTTPALLHVNPAFIVEFIPFNTHTPPFDSRDVRQALNYAIDRRKIAQLYGGSLVATPLCQPLAPGLPGYVRYCPYTRSANTAGTYNGPNLRRARKLLAASGRQGAHIDVWGTNDVAGIPPSVPTYVANVLRSLGFNVTLHIVHLDRVTEARRRTFQISVDGDWLPDFPSPSSYLPSMFGCDGSTSNGFVCNKHLDQLMQQATAASLGNPSESIRLWAAADRDITNNAYWAPTVNIREVDLVSPRLHNYEFNPVWGFLADQAWIR